ncbi:MAG: hypothetical protein EOO67_14395, partial [Microbacterium sp.]
MAGRIAIVGLGHTAQGELPGLTVEEIAADAAAAAVADAGLGFDDLDGLIACKSIQGNGADTSLGPVLGLDLPYVQTLQYGSCNFSLHLAAMAIATGMASTILLTYGANARSSRYDFAQPMYGADVAAAAGLVHIAGRGGLALQRHKALYGTTDEQFGMLAVGQRQWAQRNPHAIFRDELTMDDYLASSYLVEPLRRADVTMISDGGIALVVTTAERAADLPQRPVYLAGMSEFAAVSGERSADTLMRPWIADAADALWSRTGLG